MDLAERINAYRVIPRALVLGYSYMIWDTVQWYQTLEAPSTQQAALITTLVGISAAIFSFYTTSGGNK